MLEGRAAIPQPVLDQAQTLVALARTA
jgi:hypothetical protein